MTTFHGTERIHDIFGNTNMEPLTEDDLSRLESRSQSSTMLGRKDCKWVGLLLKCYFREVGTLDELFFFLTPVHQKTTSVLVYFSLFQLILSHKILFNHKKNLKNTVLHTIQTS